MTNSEIVSFIDEAIRQEMLLGAARNDNRLTGLRNIKSDFNYIASKENLDALDILKRLYKERKENETTYNDAGKIDLWLQEKTESDILFRWLPKEPEKSEVLDYLTRLTDIPKQKSSFKKYQDACIKHFGQKVESSYILEYINSK